MLDRNLFAITLILCFSLIVDPARAQDEWSDLLNDDLQLDAIPQFERIDDISGTIRLLREEGYRPVGPAVSLGLSDAIDLALGKNPQMRIAISNLYQSLQSLEVTESGYRGLFDLNSRFDENIRTFSTGQFRFDPNLGMIQDDVQRSTNQELFVIGPRYRQTFRNGAIIEINPRVELEHRSDGSFRRTRTRPDGYEHDARGNINMSLNVPINSRPREEIRVAIENAQINTIQADQSLYLQEKITEESVINTYWNIKTLERRLQIQNERLIQAMQIEFIRRTQYEFEQASQMQVGEAQIDVLNQQAEMINQEGQLRNSIELFNILLGIPVDANLTLVDDLSVEPLPLRPSEYISLVTESNLELENLRLQIRQTENNLGTAMLGQQPDLSFVSSFSRTDEGGQNIGVGMVFNWNFGDGGATKARVRVLQENLEQQQIQLWNRERVLVQETYNDLRSLQLQTQRIEILERNVAQAEQTLDNALFNFREFGQISFRDLQDLQVDVANSRVNLVNAIMQYNIAKSSLMQKIHEFTPSDPVAPLFTKLHN